MSYTISKDNLKEAEMLLNIIINSASTITSGNVSHHSNEIKGSAQRVKLLLTKEPTYTCYRCKDTGVIPDEEYRGHSEGFVPIEKPCSCRQKK